MKFNSDKERNTFSVIMIIVCLILAYLDMKIVSSIEIERFTKVITKNLEV